MTTPDIKVNEFVIGIMTERKLATTSLAASIGLSNDSTYKLLKRDDWRISELKKVGDFLKINLFELYTNKQTEQTALIQQLKAKEEEITALKQKMDLMEIENKYLKEMVELAKMKLKH